MQANNDITIAFGSPVKHSFHEAKYEQGYCSSSIDEDCGIASTDFETETKVKHASVDILQLLADTGNVTVSKASRVAWKRYENQTAIKRHRPCSRMFVESLIRDPLQDLMGPWNHVNTSDNIESVKEGGTSKVKSSLEAPWKRWWNDDSIFSWVKQSPPEQNSLKNGARTFRNKKLLKKTSSAKDESFISLPSQYLNGSYVNVGRDSIVDELPLDGGPATKPIIEAPKRSGPFGKTIRKVRSRPDLKAYKNDSAPSPTPEPIIHEAQAKPKHSLVRKQKIIGLGISGIHIPDFSATEDPEVTQTSPGNRLDDHPPRLPEISVSVSFSEGESVCWSFQSSPVSDSLGSAAFSHLSCSSEYENLKEERDTAGLVEPSMPASTSSYEHMRSIVKPLLNEDDYSSTLSPLIDGDLSLVSARFSIDEPKSFLKDFQKNLFSRTQRSNTNFQKIKKNDNIDIAFSTYPLQPQYQAHGYNSQRHPNHIFPWTTYNIWCYHCTKKTCSRCGNRCCFLTQLLDIAFPGCPMVPKSRPTLSSSSSSFSSSSIFSTPLPSTPSPASPTSPTALDGLAKPKAATSPDAKKQAMKAIREIVALYPAGGKDALDMFLRCTSCERTVCSMCCGVCPEELCGDLQCKDCKTDPWARCDWHW